MCEIFALEHKSITWHVFAHHTPYWVQTKGI